MSVYTLVVWYTNADGERIREPVSLDIRLPFHWASEKAAELSERYGPDRTYAAVNVSEFESE
jgi:hypothetical protein